MGKGGSYVADDDGNPQLVVEPTKDHPEGNSARDAAGNRLDRATPPVDAPAAHSDAPAPAGEPVQDNQPPPVFRSRPKR